MPTYNEKANVRNLVSAVGGASVPNLELLFVDDSSPDGTGEELRAIASEQAWVHLLIRESKKGIGSAYRDGFGHALSNLSPDIIVEMDADLQHPPEVLVALVGAVVAGANVAVASRYVEGGGVAGWSRSRRLVSRVANSYARDLLRLPVKDCTSGFRAFDRAAVEKLLASSLPTTGFEFQVAALRALKMGMKIVEVPYTFEPRKAGESKLGLGDILKFAFRVFRMALS